MHNKVFTDFYLVCFEKVKLLSSLDHCRHHHDKNFNVVLSSNCIKGVDTIVGRDKVQVYNVVSSYINLLFIWKTPISTSAPCKTETQSNN